MPLAVTDAAWDVGRHCGLCLTWMAMWKKGGERKRQVNGMFVIERVYMSVSTTVDTHVWKHLDPHAEL